MVNTVPSLKLIAFVNHLLNTESQLSWPQLFDDTSFTKLCLINFVHKAVTARPPIPLVLWTCRINFCIKRAQNTHKNDSIKKTERDDYERKKSFASEEQIIWWPFVQLSMFRKRLKDISTSALVLRS